MHRAVAQAAIVSGYRCQRIWNCDVFWARCGRGADYFSLMEMVFLDVCGLSISYGPRI